MSKRISHYEEADQKFLEALGLTYPYNRPKSEWNKKADKSKSFSVSDPHNPYMNKELQREMLNHKDAVRLVVPGDVADFYSKSRFPKKRNVSFKEEAVEVFYFFEWCATHFEEVKIMTGNHDDRPEKKLRALLGDDVDLIFLTERNLVKRLASYFDNIEVVGTNLETQDGRDRIELTHLWQMGDIIFTHGELSLTQASAIMERISRWLFRWKTQLGLKPYNVIIQGHNHTAYSQIMGDELWFLHPCSVYTKSIGTEYIYNTRVIGNPPVVGYMEIYQEKGKTDWNRTRYFKF